MKTMALLLLLAGLLPIEVVAQAPATPPPAATPPANGPLTAPATEAETKELERVREEVERARQERIHARWSVIVDVQMVAVEEAKAIDLLVDLQSGEPAKAEAAWSKIQAMIKSREAILLAWPMVRTVDGSRAVAESIVEQRYPTEFESPLPSPPTAGSATLAPVTPAPAPAAPPAEKPLLVDHVDAVPTGFETRNAGATLEVEPTVLDEGKRIYLEIVPQRVELLEMERIESFLAHDTAKVITPQPLFATSKTTQSIVAPSGLRLLIGVHMLTKPANYIEFHFLRAVATKME